MNVPSPLARGRRAARFTTALLSLTTLLIQPIDLAAMSSNLPPDVSRTPGPLPGQSGYSALASTTLTLPLDEELGPRGSLSFWFRTDRTYRSGPDQTRLEQPLVRIPDLASITFLHTPEQVSLLWRWNGIEDRGDVSLNVQLPGLPGPAWIHFAANWDADAGVFDVFLNGTPLRAPGTRIDSWEPGAGNRAEIHLDRFAISSFRADTDLLTEAEIRREVTPLYSGNLDGILGARDRGTFDAAPLVGDLIYEVTAEEDLLADWTLEGPGLLTFQDEWLRIRSERPDGPEGHAVLWYEKDLPDSFLAQWEMQLLKTEGLCIVFVGAKGRRGEDLFAPALQPRNGVFGQYINGDIDTYHISFYPNSPVMEPGRTTSNMRKNHGFLLVDNGPVGIPIGSRAIHRLTLLKEGPRLRLAVDGRLVIDFTDDGKQFGPRLKEGKFGLRQMQWTDARYRNFSIHTVRSEPILEEERDEN